MNSVTPMPEADTSASRDVVQAPRVNAGRADGFSAASQNMRQLILLNWVAIIGQLAAIAAASAGLGIPLPLMPMLAMVAVQTAANLVFIALLARREPDVEFMLALSFAVVALTIQLYLSGGTDNPFSFLFLLHVVLGAILLAPSRAAVIAIASVLFFCVLSIWHLPLVLAGWSSRESELIMSFGRWSSFGLVAILLTVLVARINRNLRLRDEHLYELGQKRVEDLAIMRMGLFASGAAHELGTPLSSLAVLIADWRRQPAIASDQELASEMDVALHEVTRCKSIVSNILHSSGYARSEELKLVDAGLFLSDIVETWVDVRADFPVELDLDAADGAFIAFQPALQQAISSILDNAVEAGSTQIWVSTSRDHGELRISVIDSGPGFPAYLLGSAGKLYESSKGPGHGVGLFLANNVARQLGGYLQIGNRPEGGARVQIALPIMKEG